VLVRELIAWDRADLAKAKAARSPRRVLGVFRSLPFRSIVTIRHPPADSRHSPAVFPHPPARRVRCSALISIRTSRSEKTLLFRTFNSYNLRLQPQHQFPQRPSG
jgi:hypothetical protein